MIPAALKHAQGHQNHSNLSTEFSWTKTDFNLHTGGHLEGGHLGYSNGQLGFFFKNIN